jgi:microcystin-dependent protein
MAEPFVGQIMMFGGNFSVRGWAHCNGQLLAVNQNDALFSLLGTTYGGDGRTTFGLPDMRGRVPIHEGQGAGLSNYALGAKVGAEHVAVAANEMPPHQHGLNAEAMGAVNPGPDQGLLAEPSNTNIYGQGTPPDTLDCSAIGEAGSGNPHDNVMPFQCISFLISLTGIYPSRN